MTLKSLSYLFLSSILFYATTSYGQGTSVESDSLFSFAISKNIKKYTIESNKAYRQYDFKRGEFLFDSIVNNCLKDKHFNNFKAQKLNGKIVDISKHFEKPTFIVTYASWCIIPEGEINAINDLASKYNNVVDFVVLFWDNKKDAKKASKPFNNKVTILHIDEKKNIFSYEVKTLKHTFGFPTTYFIDNENRLSNILRPNASKNPIDFNLKSYSDSYASFTKELIKISPTIELDNSNLATK